MTKEEYWDKLITKNPSFKNDTVNLKTKSLKLIVIQAFELGIKSVNQDTKTNNPFDNLFNKGYWK
jgi:hypothetical protein